MSDTTARRLERELKHDGRFTEFVLLALEGMTREGLDDVMARAMELRARQNPASEALRRGLRDSARLQSGEISPGQLAEELQRRPLRQWDDEEASRQRAARGFEQFMGLPAGSVTAEPIGDLEE